MPANATFKQREYAKLEALAQIAYDEFVNSVLTFDNSEVSDFQSWNELNDAEHAIWVGVVQAVRVGVLRGVA